MVRPAMVTVAPAPTSKTRLALLPLTVSLAAPGPSMVMLLVRFSWPPVKVMVPCRLGAKAMTAPEVLSAAATAARSEPGTLSVRVVTRKVLGKVRFSSSSRQGRKPAGRRPTPGRRFLGACLDCPATARSQPTNGKRDMVELLRGRKNGALRQGTPLAYQCP